ncbi:hypothetical protein VDGD_21464 [Verticillium dahliae]|nr:hypothetical protein VDGD_21464 [Verticillium dahliae]
MLSGSRPSASILTPKVLMPRGPMVSRAVEKLYSSVRTESPLSRSQSMRKACSRAPVLPTV